MIIKKFESFNTRLNRVKEVKYNKNYFNMKIRKFNEGLEDHIIDGERTEGKGKYAKGHFFVDKLKDGFAISISKENVDKFFDILKDITWVEVPKTKEHYTSSKYYFVLFGNRLLHSDKPYFGGNELEVYTPSF